MYKCAECGKPVAITNKLIVRSCKHTESPVIADLTAEARGKGGVR